MMKRLLTLLALILMTPAYAQAGSLFFSDDELKKIQNDLKNAPSLTLIEDAYVLHLASLIYYSPDRWSLWMQGKQWTPQTSSTDFTIKEVTPTSLTLDVTLKSGKRMESVVLRPHQSLNLLTGKITEGLTQTPSAF